MKRALAYEYASLLSESGHACRVIEKGSRSAQLEIDGEESGEVKAFCMLKQSIGVMPDKRNPKQRMMAI